MRLWLAFIVVTLLFFVSATTGIIADDEEDSEKLEEIEKYAEYFDKAQDSLQSGQYKTARRYFKKIVSIEDENYLSEQEYAQARIGLAQVYMFLGEKIEALKIFADKIDIEKLAELDVNKHAALLHGYAQTLKYFGKLADAEKIADKLISKTSDNEIYVETAGEIAYLQGNWEKAQTLFQKVEKLIFAHEPTLKQYDRSMGNRNVSNVYLAACKARYFAEFIENENHLKQAFDYAKNAVYADKHNIDAYYWAAKITLETETHIDARNLYLEVVKKFNNQHPGISRLMMQTYLFESDLFKASAEVDAIMQYLPNSIDALLAKIELCNREQKYADTKLYIDELLELNPAHKYGISLKALNCLHLGDNKGFAEIERKILENIKKHANFYVSIVQGLTNSLKLADAVMLGEKGLKLTPKNYLLMKQLGFAYAKQGLDEKRAYELLKSANFNDTLRNKLFTLNISQTLRVLQEEFKSQTSRDGNFIIKLHESAFDLIFPYFEDALMTDFVDLQKKYSFKPVTPIIIEGFHRLDDFGSRTIGLPSIQTFGESFGRLITLALPQASNPGTFSWRRVIRREMEKTFQIQMSRGNVPVGFLKGSTQHALVQYRKEWRMHQQLALVKSFFKDNLIKISNINFAVASTATSELAVYQASLMLKMLEEKHGGAEIIKKMLDLFSQNKTLEQAISAVTGLSAEEFDNKFKQYIKSEFIDCVKVVARPGLLKLQELVMKYETDGDKSVMPELCWAYYSNGMKEDAYKLANKILVDDSNDKFALCLKGLQVLETAGDNAVLQSEAIEYLTKAVDNGFADYEIYILLGRLYQQDSPTDAKKCFEHAIAAFPDYVGTGNAYMFLMQIHAANNENLSLLQIAEKICEQTELQLGARIALAKYYITQNDSVSVAYWLRGLIESIPQMNDIPDGLENLHELYASSCEQAELWDAAALEWRICMNFVKLDKMKAPLYLKSAKAYKNAKKYDLALEMVAKALEISDTQEAHDLKLTIELAKSKSEKN